MMIVTRDSENNSNLHRNKAGKKETKRAGMDSMDRPRLEEIDYDVLFQEIRFQDLIPGFPWGKT